MRSELIDLDLAKFADIADALATKGAEVSGDARVLEVDNTSEGLVEKTADGKDREVTGFGLGDVRGFVKCMAERARTAKV